MRAADKEILEASEEGKWMSGTTVVLAILWNETVWVANLGDSEAVMGKRRTEPFVFNEDLSQSWHEPFVASKKHKPNDPEEKDRIKKAGGHVVFGRVMGSLAVARALGDRDFKHPHNHSEGDFVTCEPHVMKVDLLGPGGVEFMLLSCDGLWDRMHYDRAVHWVSRHRHDIHDTATLAQNVQGLVHLALDRGSLDNISAILVLFPALPTPSVPEPLSALSAPLPAPASPGKVEDDDEDEEVEVDALQYLKEQYLKKKQQQQHQPSASDLKKDTKLQQLIQYFQLNPHDDEIQKDYVCSLEKNMVLYPGILALSKKHLCFFSKFAGTTAVHFGFASFSFYF
jgi:serine/threonine protein phosphatase PrpC